MGQGPQTSGEVLWELPLCMAFTYHVHGTHVGCMLHVDKVSGQGGGGVIVRVCTWEDPSICSDSLHVTSCVSVCVCLCVEGGSLNSLGG